MISSDFHAVYESAGKKADGIVNLFCRAHIRRQFVRADDANPAQLGFRLKVARADPAPVRRPPPAHRRLAQQHPRRRGPRSLGRHHRRDRRRPQGARDGPPGLQEPTRKALATLDRGWDGLTAHRDYPMIGLDNNPAGRAVRGPVVTRKNAYGSRNADAARSPPPCGP